MGDTIMEARAFWENFKKQVEENNDKLKAVWSARSESGKGENPLPMSLSDSIYIKLRETLYTFPILL